MNNGWAAGGGFTLLTWRLEVRAPPGRSLYDGVLEVPTGKRYLCACFCPRVLYIHTTLATWLSKAPDKFIPEILKLYDPYFCVIDGGDFAEENVDTQPLGLKSQMFGEKKPGRRCIEAWLTRRMTQQFPAWMVLSPSVLCT